MHDLLHTSILIFHETLNDSYDTILPYPHPVLAPIARNRDDGLPTEHYSCTGDTDNRTAPTPCAESFANRETDGNAYVRQSS